MTFKCIVFPIELCQMCKITNYVWNRPSELIVSKTQILQVFKISNPWADGTCKIVYI